MTTTTTITTGETVAQDIAERAALVRVARSRAARATVAQDIGARAALARLTARMGEDTTGAALLAALSTTTGEDTTGDIVAAAWATARRTRNHAALSAAADAERATYFATGAAIASCATCRGTGETSGETCDACTGTGRETSAARVARVMGQYAHLSPTQRAAVAAAFASDGVAARPDHDPASCTFGPCAKCRAIRARTGETSGALTREPRRGKVTRRPPSAADRAPRERTANGPIMTTRGRSYGLRVELLRESDLSHALDATAHHHATTVAASPATVRPDNRPRYVTAAHHATVETVGRRGRAVAWAEWAAGYSATTGARVDIGAWRVMVSGYVGAWAMARGLVSPDEMTRLARAAGIGTAELATAITRADAAGERPTTARLVMTSRPTWAATSRGPIGDAAETLRTARTWADAQRAALALSDVVDMVTAAAAERRAVRP